VPIAVVRTYQRRRSGQRQLRWLFSVCLRSGGPVLRVRQRYRRRFGIETGDRLMEPVRADDRAQSGVALPVDGCRVVDCDYVDPLALAVPAAEWAWATACSAVALSVRSDAELPDTRD
jgi:hypothetical protein